VPELNLTGNYQMSGKLLGHYIEGQGSFHLHYGKFSVVFYTVVILTCFVICGCVCGVCVCGFVYVWVCVCVGVCNVQLCVMCGCMYVWICNVCVCAYA
jgi:hypothetical protein